MPVLVDTSVWITHLHGDDRMMSELLAADEVVAHPLVIGELACGSLNPRDEILSFLGELPQVSTVSHEGVLEFIERKELWGVGLSYVDVHLLAAALISNAALWTRDKHLGAAAEAMGVSYR